MIERPAPPSTERPDPSPTPPDSGLALGHRLWNRHAESPGVVSRAALRGMIARVRRSPFDRLPMLISVLRRAVKSPDADVTAYSWPFLVPGPFGDPTASQSSTASGSFDRTSTGPPLAIVAGRVARRPSPAVPLPGRVVSAPTVPTAPLRSVKPDLPVLPISDTSVPKVSLAESPSLGIVEPTESVPSITPLSAAEPLRARAERRSPQTVLPLTTAIARSTALPIAHPSIPLTFRPIREAPDAARAVARPTDPAVVGSTTSEAAVIRRDIVSTPVRVVSVALAPSPVAAPVRRSSGPVEIRTIPARVFRSSLVPASTVVHLQAVQTGWTETPHLPSTNPEVVHRAEADQHDDPSHSSIPREDRAVSRPVVARQLSTAPEQRFVFAPALSATKETSAPGRDATPGLMRTWDGTDLSGSSSPSLSTPATPNEAPKAAALAGQMGTPIAEELVDRVARKVLRSLTVEGERRGWGWSRWS